MQNPQRYVYIGSIGHFLISSQLLHFVESLDECLERQRRVHDVGPSLLISGSNATQQSKVRYELYEMATASFTSCSDNARSLTALNDSSLLGHSKNAPIANKAAFAVNDLDVLASSMGKLNLIPNSSEDNQQVSGHDTLQQAAHQAPKDLIALDTPLVVRSSFEDSVSEEVFDLDWSALGSSSASRGWSNHPRDVVTDSLLRHCNDSYQVTVLKERGMSRIFRPSLLIILEAEFKIVLRVDGSSSARALLRLSSADDGTCLWQLRCEDTMLASQVKAILAV
jgi:hypothetical protein